MFSESPPLVGAGRHPAALDDCSTRLQGKEEEEEEGEGIGSTQHVQQLQALLLPTWREGTACGTPRPPVPTEDYGH